MADLLQRRRFGWGSVFVGAGSVLVAASLIGSGPLGGIGAVMIAALGLLYAYQMRRLAAWHAVVLITVLGVGFWFGNFKRASKIKTTV